MPDAINKSIACLIIFQTEQNHDSFVTRRRLIIGTFADISDPGIADANPDAFHLLRNDRYRLDFHGLHV